MKQGVHKALAPAKVQPSLMVAASVMASRIRLDKTEE
jgi:hypothetical protein